MSLKSFLSKTTRGVLGLLPAEMEKPPTPVDSHNLESELGASDYKAKPAKQPSNAEEILRLVEDRFQAAVRGRQMHDHKFFLSLAFYLGEQNMGWSTNKKSLVDARRLNESWRTWEVRNKIKPKVLKLQARATEGQPDASFRPTLWDSPRDRQAAAEARAVRQHQNRLHDEDQQLSEEVLWALVTSTVCRKYSWDPAALAEVPDYDETGQIVGTTSAPVGEIARETVPIFDLYPDPKAKIKKGRITNCAWIIHSHTRDINDVHTHYGLQVDGDAAGGQDGYIESRLASITGDQERPGDSKTGVVVKEMWELPSLRYPQGRLIVTGGNKVLRYDEQWPCKKRDSYPFVPLSYTNGVGSFYGGNAVYDLIGAQRTYNIAINQENEALRYPQGRWKVQRGAEVGADTLHDPRETIYINPGFDAEHLPSPQVAPIITGALALADADIADLSGIHDISNGQAPPEVTAASALEILRQQDATQMRQFLTNLGTFVKGCAEWEIALASENYTEPRLLAVQDVVPDVTPDTPTTPPPPNIQPGPPNISAQPPNIAPAGPPQVSAAAVKPANQGYAQVMAFRALTNGGSCHVEIETGSSAPISPVSRLQLVQQLYQQGFFGPPGDPRASLIALQMMDEIRSDTVVERLIQLRNEMKQEADTANAALATQAQQQAAGPAAQAMQAAQGRQHEAEMALAQMGAKIKQMEVQHQQDLAKAEQAHRHALEQTLADKVLPSVSLSGKLTPEGEFAAENEAFQPQEPPDRKDIL